MTRSRLPLAVAAVLAGATVLFVVLGAVFNPVLVAAAVPFGLAGYLLWLHATGRLTARVRRRTGRDRSTRGRERERTAGRSARFGRGRGDRSSRRPPAGGPPPTIGRREALRVLDLPPEADQRAIQEAYRDRAKAVHPDAEGGDADAFRRVTAAYERLRRRPRGKH